MESSKRPSQKRPSDGTASEHGCHPKQPKPPQNVSFKRDRFGVSEMEMKTWDSWMNTWFPHLLTDNYVVPCLHLNTVQATSESVAGVQVCIPQPPVEDSPRSSKPDIKAKSSPVQVSKVREEQTLHRLLYCLSTLSVLRQNVMVVITGLEFRGYLANTPNKRPKDTPRGDFDILIINRRYGLFVAEMKAVGDILDTKNKTEQEKENIVRKKIEHALDQLEKAKDTLKCFLSDLSQTPRISCVLMLPNMPRKMLRTIKNNCPDVCKNLSRCLGIKGQCDPVDLCLCADDLSDISTPYDITERSKANLSRWWKQRIAGCGEDPSMTDDVYRELIFRFAGPPTNICKWNIHTTDEALYVTGDTFSSLRLTSEQLQAVKCQNPLVYLSGPPGTGKTQALFLKGTEWCNSGKEVHLLCTWSAGLAAAHYIKHMIEMGIRNNTGGRLKIHIQRFNLSEAGQLEKAVDCLWRTAVPMAKGTGHELYIIADEAFAGSEFEALCDQLQARIGRLHMWAASVYHGHRPRCMTEFTFTLPLRTPPTVTEEVKKSEYVGDFVQNYSEQSAHSLQPPVYGKSLEYVSHRGPGHYIGEPADCQKCGSELAKKLKGLNVGGKCLKYSDVLLLTVVTSFNGFIEEMRDRDGNVEQPASGLVQALRAAGVPVRIVKPDDEAAIGDVAKMEGPDAVIAANAETIRGLERKLVVWVQADREDEDSDEISFGRLDAMSRATAHVIVVS